MPDFFDDENFNRGGRSRGNRGRNQNPIDGIKDGLKSGAFLLAFALIAGLVYTSFYRVDASAEGVVLRFGEKVRTVSPGLQMKLPWPIESVYTVPVMKIQSVEFGFQTISADRKTVYAKRNAELDAVADMLTGDLKNRIQAMLDDYDIGVQIVTVKLQTTSPPESVKDAFQEVNRARQNKERVVNEAEGERNRQIPAARGRRDQMISEAEGYRELNVLETQGLISAFNSKLAEYEKAPEITKQRLYLEAMEEVLSSVGSKTIIDDSVNQMLPILNIGESTPGNPLRGQK